MKSKLKNYATVYLWHEILHSYLEVNNRGHLSIELATDYELAKRLEPNYINGFEGHEHLKKMRRTFIEEGLWEKFLEDDSITLSGFSSDLADF